MTRKEERINASVAYNEKVGKLRVVGGDNILSQEEYITFNKNPDFIAGAEWADRTMIEKAVKWLEDNLYEETSILLMGHVSINFNNAIEEFRKYMEDNK